MLTPIRLRANQMHKVQTFLTAGIRIQITTKHIGTSEPGHTSSSCKNIHDELSIIYVHSCAVGMTGYAVHVHHQLLFISSPCWHHTDHDGCHLSSGLNCSFALEQCIELWLDWTISTAWREQSNLVCWNGIMLKVITHLSALNLRVDTYNNLFLLCKATDLMPVMVML